MVPIIPLLTHLRCYPPPQGRFHPPSTDRSSPRSTLLGGEAFLISILVSSTGPQIARSKPVPFPPPKLAPIYGLFH